MRLRMNTRNMHFNYLYSFKGNIYSVIIIIIITLSRTVESQLIRSVEFSQKDNVQSITKPSDSSISLIEMKNSLSVIDIDLGKHQEQVIVIRNAISVKLKLSFQIHAPLLDIYKALRNQFCFQAKVSAPSSCHDIPDTNTEVKWFHMVFVIKWLHNRSGFKVTINPPSSIENDLSGFYYLKSFTPLSGMALSNYLEIRDILFWRRNVVIPSQEPIKDTYKQYLSSSDIPKIFSCLDQPWPTINNNFHYWIPLEFKSIFKWAWCPVSKQVTNKREIDKTYVDDCLRNSFIKCEKQSSLCPILSGQMPGWTEIISFEGAITLTRGEPFKTYGGQVDGYALMCYFQSRTGYKALKYIANSYDATGKEFTKGLEFVSAKNDRLLFIQISPKNQTVQVGTLKKGFILTAFYYGPSDYTYEWIGLGKKMYNSGDWVVKQYSLEYKSNITIKMEGSYYLRIASSFQSMEFVFNVVIRTPPILIKISPEPILSTVYLMMHSNFSITYTYHGAPTHSNIYINGLLYTPTTSDRKIFLNDLAQSAFNLKHLDFNFVQKTLPGGITEYTYSVRRVLFPDTLLRGQDHNLIVEIANNYGVSRSILNIYVLKPPKFESLPQDDNCTTLCSSMQPHLFRCELNTDYYLVREVHVEKFWLVNDIRLDSLPYYHLYFKNDLKGLNLKPLSSNYSDSDMAVKILLKKAKLICRVRLLYPGSSDMPDAKLIRERRIIYDTFYDPMAMNHFAAEIRIDWEPDLSTASYTWIIFLAIALLLIIMFILLLVKFTLRGQGQSYQIEKLELAKGYNRDEEIIENETIRPYLRSTNNANHRAKYSDKDSSGGLVNSSLNYSPPNTNGTFRPRDVLDIMDDGETTIDPSINSNSFIEPESII